MTAKKFDPSKKIFKQEQEIDEEWGSKDFRLDNALTTYELSQLMVHRILMYNNTQKIANFPFTGSLLDDGVQPIPLQLRNWGIANRSGLLSTTTAEDVQSDNSHESDPSGSDYLEML